jgi:AraC-like DNA-binding protein
VGLAGISRDLKADEGSHPAYSRLAAVVQYIQDNYVQPLNLKQLAAMADMSVAQLERYFHGWMRRRRCWYRMTRSRMSPHYAATPITAPSRGSSRRPSASRRPNTACCCMAPRMADA